MRSRCSPRGPTPCSARPSWRSPRIIPWRPPWRGRTPSLPPSPPTACAAAPARPRSRPRRSAAFPPGCPAATPSTGTGSAGLRRQLRAHGLRHRAPSSAARRMISAISILRIATACRCSRSCCRPMRTRHLRGRIEAFVGDGTVVPLALSRWARGGAAKRRVIAELERPGEGSGETTWRLRDWGVSRQRYWGCPIPVIHCAGCGVVPVPREQLPVELPEDVDFSRPGNPLDRHPTWPVVTARAAAGRRGARPIPSTPSWRVPGTSRASPMPMPRTARSRASGRLLVAGRPVYRRRRACDPAPALLPLLYPGHGASAAISTLPSRSAACSRKASSRISPSGTRQGTGWSPARSPATSQVPGSPSPIVGR